MNLDTSNHELAGSDVEALPAQQLLHRHYTSLLAEPEHFHVTPSLARMAEIEAVEDRWVARLDARAGDIALPAHASEFRDWYQAQAVRHTRATAPLTTYLREQASLSEVATFFVVEEKVDSRFDDLMALAQLGTSGEVKMTIGENYWDEMGCGDPRLVHTTLFDTSVRWMKQHLASHGIAWQGIELAEVYCNANQLLLYGLHRRHAPRLLGALGVLEQTASERFHAMTVACERLGVPDDVVAYQRMHVGIDHDHGSEWLAHVLVPLAARSEPLMHAICRGVTTRMDVAVRYYTCVYDALAAGRFR